MDEKGLATKTRRQKESGHGLGLMNRGPGWMTEDRRRTMAGAESIGFGHPPVSDDGQVEEIDYLGTQAGLGGSVLQSINQFAAIRAKS